MNDSGDASRVIRAPRGTEQSCRSWLTEAPLRPLMNNLDPEVADRHRPRPPGFGLGRLAEPRDRRHARRVGCGGGLAAAERASEHGGGVGIGYSQHASLVIACDGTGEAARRIGRTLWNDPASGAMRHADAGYQEALTCAEHHDLRGLWLTAGLIDCHTHLVFAGTRAYEYAARLGGASYESVAYEGGGILSTVRATRAVGEEAPLAAAGTTAVLLPVAWYCLGELRRPPVPELRAGGVELAVASDCNPGSAPGASVLLALAMATRSFGLSQQEAFAAATRGAARALGLHGERGLRKQAVRLTSRSGTSAGRGA